jgi:hypothetical protein
VAGAVLGGVNGFNTIEDVAKLTWGLRRGNQGGRVTALTQHLRCPELGGGAVGFGGGAVELGRCGRRVMTSGAHLSARRGEVQRWLRAGPSPYGESGNRVGVPLARGHVGPMERDIDSGRNGPAREVWADWAKIKGVF